MVMFVRTCRQLREGGWTDCWVGAADIIDDIDRPWPARSKARMPLHKSCYKECIRRIAIGQSPGCPDLTCSRYPFGSRGLPAGIIGKTYHYIFPCDIGGQLIAAQEAGGHDTGIILTIIARYRNGQI